MPVWLQNTLIGLIIFTLTLRLGLLPQVVVCALALGVVMFFSTLGTFRRTAQSLNASTKYFTRLIVVPWVTAAGVGVFVWFTHNLPAKVQFAPTMGLVIGLMLVQGLYGLTMYQAMINFDRACSGRRLGHDDPDAVANFLKYVS